jgi:hypothetical protein
MTKQTIFILTLFLAGFCAQAQPYFEWANSLGGTEYDIGNAVATDAQGNVYTTGYFVGTADFDPGSKNYDLTAVGDIDVFVSKTDAAGNFIWAMQLAGVDDELATGIAVDKKGNVYVTGYFEGTADFDPEPTASYNMTSAGSLDIFICKLDASGTFVWARQMGGVTDDAAFALALDSKGNIYTTGGFSDIADFDPGVGTYTLTAGGFTSAFISKLDPSGNFLWAKNFGGASDNNWGNGITTDSKDNVFTTGYFDGAADFDPGITTYTLTSAGDVDVFISKLDSSGNFNWARHFGGINPDRGYAVKTDASGNVYTTGSFYSTCDFDPDVTVSNLTSRGNEDIFISKLDASGKFVWARGIGSGSNDAGYSIDVDAEGAVYTTGYFSDGADFDPGTGTFVFSTSGGTDIFISKLNASGNFVWAKQIGGTGFDNRGRSITVDASKNIYTAGYYNGDADFNPNPATYILSAAGSLEIFVQKMSQCLSTSSNINASACNSYRSPSGKYNWTSSNTYKDTIRNAGGCDSIISIQLIIFKPSSSSVSVNACNRYVSPSGKYTWTAQGTYTDTIKNRQGCDSILTISLSINPLDVSVSQNNSTLTAHINGAAYQWINCGNRQPVNGQTGKTFTSTINGSYAVIITLGGCSDTSACYTISTSGIHGIETASVTLFPNPSTGVVTVTSTQLMQNTTFRLTDMQGRILMEKQGINGGTFTFDMSAHASGIYFIELHNKGEIRRAQVSRQ